MEIDYKETNCSLKEAPLAWDRFSTLAFNIEKKIQNDTPESPSETSNDECEFQFLEICSNLQKSMKAEDVDSTANWLHELYVYSNKNTLTEDAPSSIIPDILFIIANENESFSIECRNCAIDTIFNFLVDMNNISDVFIECDGVSLLTVSILSDNELAPLHLSSLRCLRKISNHCKNCQQFVCDNLLSEDFEFVNRILTELSETQVIDEIHIEFFSILKNVSKFQLDSRLVEFCFNIFIEFMDISDELLRLSLLGIGNLINYQSRTDWYKIYENCDLPWKLSLYFKHEDITIIQSALLLIASIYRQKQNTETPDLGQFIGLLYYKDEENVSISTSVRYYAAVTLNEVIKDDPKFMNLIIDRDHFLDAFHDIFNSSSFHVKLELILSLEEIAINGFPCDKKNLIQNNFIKYFIEMIENGNDEQIIKTIDALGYLFCEDYKDDCYNFFYRSPRYTVLFELSEHPNDEVREKAIEFLDAYFQEELE